MITLINTQRKSIGSSIGWMLACGYLIIWLCLLQSYQPITSLPFILGLFAFSFTVTKGVAYSSRYALLSFCFILLTFVIPVKTFLFFSLGFAVFFLLESYYGQLRFLSCCTLLLMAPIFEYGATVFSFPVRLQLTAWAGRLFTLAGNGVVAAGNVISYKGQDFSVDPACMGLNMLVASLLSGIFITGFYQRKYRRQLPVLGVVFCLAGIVVLNIGSNLLRIVLLVHFAILPAHFLHEVIGLVCLLLYVLLPATWLIKKLVQRWGKATIKTSALEKQAVHKLTLNLLLLAAVAFAGFRVAKADTYSHFKLPAATVGDYKTSLFAPGIVKLKNKASLVYLKYVRGFYDSDHNPAICWKGSGYRFEQIAQVSKHGHQLYTAVLVNETEKLYTAWWYGNGDDDNTTDPLSWRWKMWQGGKQYAVINVTAATEADLHLTVEKVLHERLLQPFFVAP